MCWDRECDVEAREGVDGDEVKGWRLCDGCRVMAWCGGVHEQEGREEHCQAKGEDGRTQVRGHLRGRGNAGRGEGWRACVRGKVRA